MDPVLKRRLVGAAVLWGAAMLVLPWILDPARESTPDPTVVASSDPDREMRTIDLTPPPLRESPAVSASAPAMSEPEPSAEPPAALAEMEDAPTKAQPEVRSSQQASAPAPVLAPKPGAAAPRPPAVPAKPAAAPVVTAPKPVAATKPKPPAPAPAPAAPASVATTQPPTPSSGAPGSAWSVQVGSFGDMQNAQSLAARLLQHQHSAQVSTLVVNGRALYRVRVGHLGRREDAEALRGRIEQSMGLNGRVVPDP